MKCSKRDYIKRAIGFLALILMPVFMSSQQQKEVDSLLMVIENNTQKDSLKVMLMLKTAYKIMYNYPDEATSLSQASLILSKDLDYKTGEFRSFLFLGMSYYIKKVFSEALDRFHQALDIANEIDNKVFKSTVYANIANIHADLGEFDKAFENYNGYLEITRELNNLRGQSEALTNLGVLLTEKESRIAEGIKYLEEALSIAKQEDYKDFIPNISLNLGLANKRNNNITKALHYYDEANRLGKSLNNYNVQVLALNNISAINLMQKDYRLAEINIKKTLKLSQQTNQIEWQASAWEGLYEIYEKRGNYNEALNAYKKSVALNDSLIVLNNKEEIIKREEQYKYEKEKLVLKNQFEKQQLISNQKAEHQKVIKNSTLAIAISIITFLLIGFFLYKKRRKAQFDLKVADTELKALRAQMNPHFIFNAINSIGSYISSKDKNTAKSYLNKFSSLMRKTLENSEKTEITLEEDIELLKTYLEIENKRFSEGFNYEITVDSDLDIKNVLVPPMILQPFVENSIWHGISKINTKGVITIEAKKEHGMLLYIVDDNGIGRQQNHNLNKRSLGTKITKNRIDIINKKTNTNASLKVIDKKVGTRVMLHLPLRKLFNDD
ncbi:histidine kinase [uncultured Algibacter sp.]|uniref:tetratricopeptide repeat-containing sensor histidine kinase n=1 Tax=uncultured Algibacter sp. TaxID=298659 RepID=UPI002605B296|nr:histidine kinase [uncultured Algibacter sp.]